MKQITCANCYVRWKETASEFYECPSYGNLSQKGFQVKEICLPCPKDIIDIWVQIGLTNPWINKSYDPPFDRKSFCECSNVEELREKFRHGNWSLGTAFL